MAAPDTVGNTAFPHYLSGALSGAPIGPLARSPNWLAAATRMGDGRPMTEDTSPAGWWLDELAHAGPEHLDPAFVAGYDRKQGYPSVAADLARMRELGALTAHATVLDLGAGTGRFSLAAARECAQVIAVDVSEPMVDHLAAAAASEGLGNLTVVRSGLLGYVHDGPPVDGVFCRNVLHQVPDFWKGIALDRTATMLRPGGVLLLHDLVYDVEPSAAVAVLGRWIAGGASDPVDGYTGEDFATHIRTEHSTYTWLLEQMLERTGFEILDREVRARVYATYTCVRR
jgi:2-polyprenyl-3-methyl-5-hydroxy-6-metoxy-1,4-benzoquinol methylase